MVAFKGIGSASAAPLPPMYQQQQGGRLGDVDQGAGPSSNGNGNGDAMPLEDVDVDLSEVYFLVMHFLAGGPCQKAFAVLWNELLQHKLLPRRYHAQYSKLGGVVSEDENDDGMSYPLNYAALVGRNPHIEKDHLVKLLKQLLLDNSRSASGLEESPSRIALAANVPTLIGSGVFSLLDSERIKPPVLAPRWMTQFRLPQCKTNQVHGLTLREISGSFSGYHRSPSQSFTNYMLLDPPLLVKRITAHKTLRGHRNAVYCAIFDRKGQLVITGSDDRLVKIWSAITGLCLRGCRGHEGDITDLAVSSCNTMVASASNDCTIRVWRLPNGYPLNVLRGHQKPVTAIQFSPQQSTRHHLLSSSDDETCRIWNVSNSLFRLYLPRPEKDSGPKAVGTPPQALLATNQIVCCAFNGDGSLFVTGSSDKYARVWQAPTADGAWSEGPFHELDRLEGHSNEVNYVQFSGCAAVGKTLTASSFKEEHFSSSKTLWFSDSIVTCSRDGSAIVWTPRRRRQVLKGSRNKTKETKYWKKTYHLRIPNPPLPPQLSRGGVARQRWPTPRGVNMIVWSLDNRFVLAIMDCRICVWNSVDGTLVHCLTGHTKATFVLDVHPFDPRIAMSAGYDGRVIIWDIRKGVPITQFETGDYELVDGNFSPDGTSLVVSDEVGQMHLFAIGDEETTWKDGKYDQFFLGDFRPLIRDIHGNVLDQETQLPPEERNLQDLLCDASMIPYPEPYQSLYQHRRLGAIGMEWEPPTIMFAVGMTDEGIIAGDGVVGQPFINAGTPERRPSRVEPPVFIDEALDWEPEAVASSEDGSDYSASEDRESQDDGESLRSLENEDEGTDSEDEVQLRRSRRNKRKAEDIVGPSNRRKLRRKNRQKVVEAYPYERHYERRSGQGRHSRSSIAGTSSTGATKQESLPRSKRKAAKRALRLFKCISDEEDNDEDDGENDEEAEDEDANYTMSAFEDVADHTDRSSRQGVLEADIEAEEGLPSLPRSLLSREKDDLDGEEEISGQGVSLRRSISGFQEFCRVTKPRSQRPRKRLILKLKTKCSGSDQEGKTGQGGLSEDLSMATFEDKASTSQPESFIAKAPKKFLIKHPTLPRESTTFHVGSSSHTRIAENGPTLTSTGLCDMDQAYAGLAQEEKRKWEWKKGKAAKRVRVESSPSEAVGANDAENLAQWTDDRQVNGTTELESVGQDAGTSRTVLDPDDIDGREMEPLQMLSAAGLHCVSVATPLLRRSRNYLPPESEDDSGDAHESGSHVGVGDGGNPAKNDSSPINMKDENGHTENRGCNSDVRSRHFPDSENEKNGKLSNGVTGLRTRMNSSPLEADDLGGHGSQFEGSESELQGEDHSAEEASSGEVSYPPKHERSQPLPDDQGNPEESETESPVSSVKKIEAVESSHEEDGDRQDEENDDNSDEYKCGVSTHEDNSEDWHNPEDHSASQGSESSDNDLHSMSDSYGTGHTVLESGNGGFRRRKTKQRRQRSSSEEFVGGRASNPSSDNKVRTRRMTLLLSGNHDDKANMIDNEAPSLSQTERTTRSKVQKLKIINKERPGRHVDTEPSVHNLDKHDDDAAKGGRRTSARTRQQRVGQDQLARGARNPKLRERQDAWLLSSKLEDGIRYVPQFLDEVVYLLQGHDEFLEETSGERPWLALKGSIRAVEFCRVVKLDYWLNPKSGETCCSLTMMLTDEDSANCGESFRVDLPDLKDFPDFIIEKQRYDAAMCKHWSIRDHCQVWWEGEARGWFKGRIKAIKAKSSAYPDSPWERYQIQYSATTDFYDKNYQLHSPWELYDVDNVSDGPRPRLDDRTRSHILATIKKLEGDDGDAYGLDELQSLVHQPAFVNRTALPLSMETVKRRLEDDYYHGVDQCMHDVDTITQNVEIFYREESDLPSKLKRLRKHLYKCATRSHRS